MPQDKKKKKLKIFPYKLKFQPALKLKFSANSPNLEKKEIFVKVFRSIDEAEYKKQVDALVNSTINLGNAAMSTESVYKIIGSSDDAIKSSPQAIMNNLLNAVKNGGKILKTLKKEAENFNIIFKKYIVDEEGWLNFTDLTITFNKLGKYRLLFIVDGVESDLSNEISVSLPEITVERWVRN